MGSYIPTYPLITGFTVLLIRTIRPFGQLRYNYGVNRILPTVLYNVTDPKLEEIRICMSSKKSGLGAGRCLLPFS